MIDLKNITDDELKEIYKYRMEIPQKNQTDSPYANKFISELDDISQIGVAFLPFQITEEISRRWIEEKE